ncbi:hypothetical protein EGN69_00365 [Pseudomonas monteilii]|nr:hypothetical protein EGN69_00365 [Pseudomonas monteilii]
MDLAMHKTLFTVSVTTLAGILSGVVLHWINLAPLNGPEHAMPTAVSRVSELSANLELSMKLSIKML